MTPGPPPTGRAPFELPEAPPLAVPEGFAARLAAAGIDAPPAVVASIAAYLGALLAMNERMNLTAVRDADDAWTRHAFDALTLLPLLAVVPSGGRVVDVGSGGGVPGIPLAIARPDLVFTLVESTKKKGAFLVSVAAALGLRNVTVRAERAEALAAGPLGGTFHAVTARAVARLLELVPLTLPFARRGGRLLLIKGEKGAEELTEAENAIARGGGIAEPIVETPTGRIVVIRRR